MRFGSTLREKALLALEEAVQEARYRCPRRSFALRFALAFLWSQAKPGAEREAFDDFWKALSRRDMWRFGACDRALQAIHGAIGAERDEAAAMRMWVKASSESGTFSRVEGEEEEAGAPCSRE